MALESQGSSLVPALIPVQHHITFMDCRAAAAAPCTFLSLAGVLLDCSEAEQISSKVCCQPGVGASCASPRIPQLQYIVPLQVIPQGSCWAGSEPPDQSFSAHLSGDHFSRGVSLITLWAKEILVRKGKSSQGHSCK